MFCPKCGKNLPDGSKFCSACGEKLAAPEAVKEPEVEIISGAEVAVKSEKTNVVAYTKKLDVKKLLPIIGAAAAVVLVIILLGSLFSGGVDGDFAYLSDGKYRLITDVKEGESLEIASAKSDYTYGNMLRYSPDGKYIYYFTKLDYYNDTGTLCRAEYAKLKKDSSKNDKYIEIIATNVYLYFQILDDGTLLYQNGDDSLYFYNGAESVQIAKNVDNYFTDDGRLIYTTYSDGYSLYGVELKDLENKIKLDSGIEYLVDYTDLEDILYVKEDDEGDYILYSTGFGKDITKLGEDVTLLGFGEDKFYYAMPSEQTVSLAGFVQDDYAVADAAIQEPNSDDYSIPEYSYEMVYGSNLVESDYEELYTSVSRDLYWYGESTWWCYSMEDAVDMDWGDNTDALVAATQSFIDRFGGSADDNGYIRVTPEVKAALMEIQAHADEPENEWQWLWLCYNKYQSGTTLDYDAYEAAYDQWYAAQNREYIRQGLNDPENALQVDTIYCYENGTATALCENMVDYETYSGCVLYNTTDLVTDKLAIDEIYGYYDVYNLFDLNLENQNNLLLLDSGKTVTLSTSAADTLYITEEETYFDLIATDKDLYLFAGDGTLSHAQISGSEVGSFSIIADDAIYMDTVDNVVYYAANSYENNSYYYCDLYACEKGEPTRLAQDIMRNDIILYSDGQILGYSGYHGGGYELTMYNTKGEATIIADDVYQFARVDKSTLLYISDGDLFLYDGKERRMIGIGVEYFWTREHLEITAYLSAY